MPNKRLGPTWQARRLKRDVGCKNMEYIVICTVALIVSGVSLFSGFGLGTVLMPAFALFFPVPIAVAASAVVHFANNCFKVFLVGRHADWDVVRRFALPGAVAAIIGAATLNWFANMSPLLTYQMRGHDFSITTIKIVIGSLIVGFACFELVPRLTRLAFDRKYLILGGVLSGFFGGLSGNQGALRSAFLLRAGLSKEAFVGTGTASAVLVDISRLMVYGLAMFRQRITADGTPWGLVVAGSLAAFIGSFIGSRLLAKVTVRLIQVVVGVLLGVVGVGLATGLL